MIGIFGATGFLGRHLTYRLCERRSPVRAVSRNFDGEFNSSFRNLAEIVEADLYDSDSMISALQGLETVVQLISTSNPSMKNDRIIEDITENVVSNVEFLQQCVSAQVKRFIFLSSGGTIYGPGAAIPTPEIHPTNPINSYGITKLMAEKYIQLFGHVDGLEYVILRVANPFGPGQTFRKGQGLVPAVIDRWKAGLPVKIYGNGDARRDYIFVKDVIEALEAAIDLEGSPQLVLNIGSGKSASINEVLDAIESVVGSELKREYIEARDTDVDVTCLDISQANKQLNWRPATEFADGLKITVNSMLAK